MECGIRITEMNFILPHSFELDLPGIPLLSTLELLLFEHSNRCIRVTVLIMGDHLWLIYLNCQGIYSDRLYCFRIFDAQDRLFDLFCYTGETSRLWWASVLLLSEPRQPVPAVRVPYQPSVFAPFCFKSAGLALIWASAVLLWFLALLYRKMHSLSIRRVHNKSDILLHQKSKFLGYMNFVFPVHCSTSPGKGSATQIVQGHRRHCAGMLNRYHHRACSYINLICPL